MKVTCDVLGVEQSLNFDTMEENAFVVVSLFGQTLRLPITEEQMEQMARMAAEARRGAPVAPVFDETREKMAGPPSLGVETTERSFEMVNGPQVGPVLRELSEVQNDAEPSEEPEDAPPGLAEMFGSEEQQAQALRARQLQRNRRVESDEQGNPVSEAAPARPLPRLPGLDDDMGFSQG